jgi:hypothetical protein
MVPGSRFVRVIGAIATFCAVSGAAEAIPLTNFSFEDGAFVSDGNGTMVLPVGSTVMTGWTVVGDQLAWITTPNPWGLSAQDGANFLDLTAYPTGAPFGGVQQDLTTIPSHLYSVQYYIGTYTDLWGGPPVSILASAAGQDQACTVTTTSAASTWTPCVMTFTANSSITSLSFLGSAGFQYIGLDNVSVDDLGPVTPPVPEPTTALLLCASGLVAVGRALRQRGTRRRSARDEQA